MIRLPDWLHDELIRRARAESPREACGLIGRRGTDLYLYSAENAAESPTDSFVIGPKEQLALLRAIEDEGQELVAIWHSHAHSGPNPSERDRFIARAWPGLAWVIVGLVPIPDIWIGLPAIDLTTCPTEL